MYILRLHFPLSPPANLPPTLLPLNSTRQPHLRIPYELPNDANPALMLRQISIELLSHLMQRRQSRPGHSREVMVLIMQAHIIRQRVQGAIIRIRLRDRDIRGGIARPSRLLLEDVVLGDEMACAGMERAGEERGED